MSLRNYHIFIYCLILLPINLFANDLILNNANSITLPANSTSNYGYIEINQNSAVLIIPNTATVNVFNSGWINLNAGQLIVNGNLNAMTLNISHGTLAGTGFVNTWGIVQNTAGTVMPGSTTQIGTLNFAGDYTQGSAATLWINAASSGASSLQIAGTANLNGLLKLNFINGFIPTAGTSYNVLQANVITGEFTNQRSYFAPTLYFQPVYNNNSVVVIIGRDYLNPYLVPALTQNELAIATTFNTINQNLKQFNPDFNIVMNAIDALPNTAAVANAFQQLQPISNNLLLDSAINNAVLTTSLFIPGCTTNIYQNVNCTQQNTTALSITGSVYNYQGKTENLLQNQQQNLNGQAGMFNWAYALKQNFVTGLIAEWNQANSNLTLNNEINHQGLLISPYVTYHLKQFYSALLLGYGNNDYQFNRTIQFNTINRIAKANPDSNEFLAYANTAYDLAMNPSWFIGPDLSLQYINLALANYTESGANTLDLNVAQQNLKSLRSNIGIEISYSLAWQRFTVAPFLNLSYAHEFYDDPQSMSFNFSNTNGTETSIGLTAATQHFILVNSGVSFSNNKNWNVTLSYTGQLANKNSFNAISAGFTWNFS